MNEQIEVFIDAGGFEDALHFLKDGYRVAREGWNGPNQYVMMQSPDENSKMRLPYLYLCNVRGELVPWLPSQGDLFATDWKIVFP